MELENQNTQNLTIISSHDLLDLFNLKNCDEILILDRKFRVRDLSNDKSTSEVKLYLLNELGLETNVSMSLSSLIGVPFIKL